MMMFAMLVACKSYKQDVMFKSDEEYEFADISLAAQNVETNYKISPNDRLQVEVYTQGGERIIDPDFELYKDLPGNTSLRPVPEYLVNSNGGVVLPKVGEVELAGLTLSQANDLLEQKYAVYYTQPYVLCKYTNKRVVILGGVSGQVIPLLNENTTILEVLALAGGLTEDAKADNIKVFRKDQAFQLNFGNITGWRQSNIVMQPGDIIYVEPIKKPLPESISQLTPILGFLTSIATLLVVILR